MGVPGRRTETCGALAAREPRMQQADIDVRAFALQVRLGLLDRCLAEELADAGAPRRLSREPQREWTASLRAKGSLDAMTASWRGAAVRDCTAHRKMSPAALVRHMANSTLNSFKPRLLAAVASTQEVPNCLVSTPNLGAPASVIDQEER